MLYYLSLLLLSVIRHQYSAPLFFAHRGVQYLRQRDSVDLDCRCRSFLPSECTCLGGKITRENCFIVCTVIKPAIFLRYISQGLLDKLLEKWGSGHLYDLLNETASCYLYLTKFNKGIWSVGGVNFVSVLVVEFLWKIFKEWISQFLIEITIT